MASALQHSGPHQGFSTLWAAFQNPLRQSQMLLEGMRMGPVEWQVMLEAGFRFTCSVNFQPKPKTFYKGIRTFGVDIPKCAPRSRVSCAHHEIAVFSIRIPTTWKVMGTY